MPIATRPKTANNSIQGLGSPWHLFFHAAVCVECQDDGTHGRIREAMTLSDRALALLVLYVLLTLRWRSIIPRSILVSVPVEEVGCDRCRQELHCQSAAFGRTRVRHALSPLDFTTRGPINAANNIYGLCKVRSILTSRRMMMCVPLPECHRSRGTRQARLIDDLPTSAFTMSFLTESPLEPEKPFKGCTHLRKMTSH